MPENDKTKNSKIKKSIYTILFMFSITIMFISILSFIYIYTKPMIKFNAKIVLQKAILYSAGVNLPDNDKQIEKMYSSQVKEIYKNDKIIFYEVYDININSLNQKDLSSNKIKNHIVAYVVPVEGPGLWGEIKSVIAISKDLKLIKGLEFIEQNETPGLGARISEKWFKEQFRGKTLPLLLVAEKTSKNKNEVNAITGATRTSTFVLKLVNFNFDRIIKIIKENNK